ncbi:unnamed protein product [Adineta steineri]|uniref:Cytochrome P450 n=1 Tax=Adineta steineri TaxID=433720 RepID=A0A819G4P4_9BILA|nr:unnamed protein product [Adineta steineri]CAF3880192.1 unnamed protein product [Adineta steineri]
MVLVVTIYLYLKWKYFSLRGTVPGLKPEFRFGNLRQLGVVSSNNEFIDSLMHGAEKMQRRYGDIFQFWMGLNHVYVFCRPEYAAHIFGNRQIFDRSDIRRDTFGLVAEDSLITLIGPKYRRHFKIISPVLRRNRILPQTSIMVDGVDRLISIWKERYENNENAICTCMQSDIRELIVDIFLLITLDYDMGSLKRLLNAAKHYNTEDKSEPCDFSMAFSIWLDIFKRRSTNGIPFFINYYLLKFDNTYQKAVKTLEDYVDKIILNCKEKTHPSDKPINLITSLVSALQTDEVSECLKSESEKTGLTKKELLGEVLFLFVAGFDTTVNTLSWFIYYVSKKPEIQRKIKEELKRNGITRETILDNFDLLNECKYIDCVVKETLRIAPFGLGAFRTVTEDTIIDGVKFRKGENIVCAFSLIQNDPRYWKLDPTQFIPERFYGTDAPDANHHPFAFFPFGGGHRTCIGQDLARLELKIIIIRLMQFVTLIDAPGNNGGHHQQSTAAPKEMAISIKFD